MEIPNDDQMTITTQVNKNWYIRMFIIIVALFVFALWALYDGAYAYPRHNTLVDLWKDHDGNLDTFISAAEEAGFSDPKRPTAKAYSSADLMMQWIMLGFSALLGLWVLVFTAGKFLRKLGADDQGVHWGSLHVPYTAITDVNRAKWDSKGIAVLHFSIDNKDDTLTLDDWHYRGADQILEAVERHTGIVD